MLGVFTVSGFTLWVGALTVVFYPLYILLRDLPADRLKRKRRELLDKAMHASTDQEREEALAELFRSY